MFGRLIQKFKASVARLDTAATATASGYDDIFGSVLKSDAGVGTGIGTSLRQEHAAMLVPCQVGSNRWEALQASDMGVSPDSDFVLYFLWYDLERLGLVDATTKRSLIGIGDRIVSLNDYVTEEVVLTVPTPPGLYVVEATPRGWGLGMLRPTRNLLRVVCRDRPRR